MATGLASITAAQWAEFCSTRGIRRLEVFGSMANGQATRDSDADLLLTVDEGVTLFDWVEIREALTTMLGCPVDILSRAAVEEDANVVRRKSILQSARVIHES